MKLAIIDAEIIGKSKHRFPNLACMKLSGWHKKQGDNVTLKTGYDGLDEFDIIYISKVFTKTIIPSDVVSKSNIKCGGTGFFYDKAPPLPPEIEHTMPDYHLYDDWVRSCIESGAKEKEFTYYQNYSIGFVTRGCFRQCEFCVNRNSIKSESHSPLDEFVDSTRKKICLLDDNFLACAEWKRILAKLQQTGKPFQFKQGLDERLLTDEKCELLFKSKYDERFIFAFDNIKDSELIQKQLIRLRKYTNKTLKFYVFCAFDRNNFWDEEFWLQDIYDMFKRIEILGLYRCYPYIMKFEKYINSPYKDIYTNVARWCNQPAFFNKMSYIDFCLKNGERSKAYKSAKAFIELHELFEETFNKKMFAQYKKGGN